MNFLEEEDSQKLLNGTSNTEGQWSWSWKFWMNGLPRPIHFAGSTDTSQGHTLLHSFVCITLKFATADYRVSTNLMLFSRFIWDSKQRPTLHKCHCKEIRAKDCWMSLKTQKANGVDHQSFEWTAFTPAPFRSMDRHDMRTHFTFICMHNFETCDSGR